MEDGDPLGASTAAVMDGVEKLIPLRRGRRIFKDDDDLGKSDVLEVVATFPEVEVDGVAAVAATDGACFNFGVCGIKVSFVVDAWTSDAVLAAAAALVRPRRLADALAAAPAAGVFRGRPRGLCAGGALIEVDVAGTEDSENAGTGGLFSAPESEADGVEESEESRWMLAGAFGASRLLAGSGLACFASTEAETAGACCDSQEVSIAGTFAPDAQI